LRGRRQRILSYIRDPLAANAAGVEAWTNLFFER